MQNLKDNKKKKNEKKNKKNEIKRTETKTEKNEAERTEKNVVRNEIKKIKRNAVKNDDTKRIIMIKNSTKCFQLTSFSATTSLHKLKCIHVICNEFTL